MGETGAGGSEMTEEGLKYSMQATDLILQKLEQQKINPDPELLDQMGWTEEDLKRFIDRWQAMKKQAETGDESARRRYQNALRSLGLRPESGGVQQLGGRRDGQFGLTEDGAVNQPPPRILDDFNTFLRERSRARKR